MPITIAHLHVSDRKNKGDRAIVLAVQELLRQRWPQCRIKDFSVRLLQRGASPAVLKKINAADLIVIGGGGIFYSYFLPYNQKFIAALTAPLIIFGAGYIREVGAPPLSQIAAQSIIVLAQRAQHLGVRDYNTKKFLVEQGIASRRIKVIGDPAVLLSETKTKLFNIDKPSQALRLGLNINYSGWLGFGVWRQDILDAYQELIKYLLKTYGDAQSCVQSNGKSRGLEIYYLQHHPGEKNIYPALNLPGLRVVNLPPSAQKYFYGRLDLVVGMMLHVGVLACGAGTPAVSVAYDLRNHSFAEFIGQPELVVDLNALRRGELLKRVKMVLSRQATYRRIFARRSRDIAHRQQSFLRQVKI